MVTGSGRSPGESCPEMELFLGYAGFSHDSGPGHPESPARLSTLIPLFERQVKEGTARFLEAPVEADLSLYRTVHSGDYIDLLEQLRASDPPVRIDGDTQVSRTTVNALRETGGLVRLLSGVPADVRKKVFSAVRPPGHHAHTRQGMGFCPVNHVALLASLRLLGDPDEKILILDFDVHHGNGTEEIISRDLPGERILFISTHRYPFYPGTGSGKENREFPSGGGILDIPLPAGTTDRNYRDVLLERVLPRWERFSPGTVLVSAGFDAHRQDPLGDMSLTEESYEFLGRALRERERGLSAAFLEGGYHLEALSLSVQGFLAGWNGT